MGKASAPSAPNYTPIAAADAQQANNDYALGQQQLQWAQNQFNTEWPYAQSYLQQQTAASAAQTAAAGNQQQFYNQTYQPIEKQFAQQSQNYAGPANTEAQAAAAMGDVSNAYDASRNSALQSLESYGIDPSQTRYQALDLSTRVGQAAASAAAGTQSRLNTLNTGLALENNAINIGRGYPGAIATTYGSAANSGSSGIGAANSSTQTGASTMGTGTSWNGLSQGALGGESSALNSSFQNNMAGAEFNANQVMGTGSLLGGLGMAGMLASDI